MALAQSSSQSKQPRYLLHNGDCMMRTEFHSLYSQMPEGYRAELVGGIVFEPSPLTWWHSEGTVQLGYLLQTYAIHTPGTAVGDNATVMLSDEDEVQPDLLLRVSHEVGGRSRLTKKGYITGAPELVAEVAFSSRALDLHLKKKRYALAGVIEYVVLCLEPKQLYWFDLKGERELTAEKSVIRSKVFPGLWIHVQGLLDLDHQLTISTLNQGLKSELHGQFAAQISGAG